MFFSEERVLTSSKVTMRGQRIKRNIEYFMTRPSEPLRLRVLMHMGQLKHLDGRPICTDGQFYYVMNISVALACPLVRTNVRARSYYKEDISRRRWLLQMGRKILPL